MTPICGAIWPWMKRRGEIQSDGARMYPAAFKHRSEAVNDNLISSRATI